jgi:hypothetical protein
MRSLRFGRTAPCCRRRIAAAKNTNVHESLPPHQTEQSWDHYPTQCSPTRDSRKAAGTDQSHSRPQRIGRIQSPPPAPRRRRHSAEFKAEAIGQETTKAALPPPDAFIALPSPIRSPPSPPIQIEVRRGSRAVTMQCPPSALHECTVWLCEVLKCSGWMPPSLPGSQSNRWICALVRIYH